MLKDRKSVSPSTEREIEAIIQKGGRTAVSEIEQPQNVQMRLLPSLLLRIDAIRERKPKGIRQSRHAWIMEAILDKLKVEE